MFTCYREEVGRARRGWRVGGRTYYKKQVRKSKNELFDEMKHALHELKFSTAEPSPGTIRTNRDYIEVRDIMKWSSKRKKCHQ